MYAWIEVIYNGLHQTPRQIVNTAIQEDVEGIGISVLSGAHNHLFSTVMDLLSKFLVYRKDTETIEQITDLTDKTAFLGLSEFISSETSKGQFSLSTGDILILYSDGVI